MQLTLILFASTLLASSSQSPNKSEMLKKVLTPIQYKVTQEGATEPAFKNQYWNHKEHGIYVDIVSGEPLFSSFDKYDSKTGWPSFTQALVEDNIVYKEDNTLFAKRTEVRSRVANSHLGHVFDDGPSPLGKRYCINSAALRFVAYEDLERLGYGKLLPRLREQQKVFQAANTKKESAMSEVATFAGGCFWCVEAFFEALPGVTKAISGYSGGDEKSPTYEDVASGKTGHRESVQVFFDPSKISYTQLLEQFWLNIDPTDEEGQFVDRGFQYSTAVFFHNKSQEDAAYESKKKFDQLQVFKSTIKTPILPYKSFITAEKNHQNYYRRHRIRYAYYYQRSGRPEFVRKSKRIFDRIINENKKHK